MASPFFLLAGAVLGVVFSVPVVAGAVWCVQVTLAGGFSRGLAASLAIASAQGGWAALAALFLFLKAPTLRPFDWVLRLLAASVLIWMIFSVLQGGRVQSLRLSGDPGRPFSLFLRTFRQAVTMPMRLPGFLALLVAVSLHLAPHGWLNALLLGLGVLGGSAAWWVYFALLAALFGRRVPDAISIRSINKLRILAVAVLGGLALIAVAPLAPGFR